MNDQRSNTPETYIAYASQAWRAAESLGPYIGLTSSSRWFEKVMDKSGAEAIYNRYKAWNVGGSQGEQDYKSALAGSAAWLAALIQDPGVGYFHREWTSSAYSLTNTSRPDLNGTGFNNATITKLIAKELWQNTYMDSTFYGGNGSDWGDFTTYHHISRIFGEDPNGGNSPLAGQDPRRAPDPGGARNLSVCGFQWHRNEYGVMMRGRAELDVFLNAIPTI
ncbi:MAG: hypothetical protein CML56_00095, partial [Rhodobacteraceae bacterium]|nr:hypothetical protein [Paracoccaceae bacterium]